MTRQMYTIDHVFGISRDLPLNYVARHSADDELVANLTRDKHVVIYGSSKQGKTCLRKHCLKEEDYITVQCSNKWTIAELHSNILKRAGYEIELSNKKSITGKNKINASLGVKTPLLSAKIGGEGGTEESSEVEKKELELDPEDANDIIGALQEIGFSKYIVLEDFHYLTQECQRDFAIALKAFHEKSALCFLIVGVWLEENRLVVYNGDLTGRIVAINADKWTNEELSKVIDLGAELLNVQFTDDTKRSLISGANESVYIVQEACRQICIQSGVTKTSDTPRQIGQNVDVRSIITAVVNQQNARYLSFVTQFAEGFQQTRLEMYKWILYPILRSESQALEQGLRYSVIRRLLEENHPLGEKLNLGNLTQALLSTASLQVSKGITPIILDYDQTNRKLNIVDRGFLLWLEHEDKQELLEEVGLPSQNDTQIRLPVEIKKLESPD